MKNRNFNGNLPFSIVLSIYLSFLPLEPVLALGSFGSVHKFIGIILIIMILLHGEFKVKIYNLWMIVFAMLTFISCIWSIKINITFSYSISILTTVGLTIILQQHKFTEDEFRLIKNLIIIVGLLIAINVVLGTSITVFEMGRTTIGYNTSRRVDYNNLALGLSFSAILLLIKINGKKNKFYKMQYLCGCLFITYAIILTGSRGGLLCLLMASVCFFFYMLKAKSIFYRFILVSIAIFMMININTMMSFMPSQMASRFTVENVISDGGSGRLGIWVSGLDYFLTENFFRLFFGVGYGTFPIFAQHNFSIYAAAHNDYIQVLIELGIIGFIVLLSLFLKEGIESIRRKDITALVIIILVMVGSVSMETVFKKVTWAALLIAHISRNSVSNKNAWD